MNPHLADPPSIPQRADRDSLGVVVIGRNEGQRLMRCLDSVEGLCSRVVYVDSGSSDGSVARSRDRGVAVVELELSIPFTAARARNAGFAQLMSENPQTQYVFFVDGDCEVARDWLDIASRFLDQHPEAAIACGRRRERHPEKSVYNLLCDIEWDVPPGEARYCGGDFLVRAEAFRQIGGFRDDLICGEEPEMCVRLREAGWRIWRLAAEMTLHDAAMYRFSQWWKRTRRGGYAFAQGAALHGDPPERMWVKESRRNLFWGAGLPLLFVVLLVLVGPAALAVLALYPLNVVRLALRGKRGARENWW